LFQTTVRPEMTDPVQALDWHETELANLVAAVRQAADLGRPDIAAQIAVASWGFFQRTAHLEDWLAVSQIGVHCAVRLGDDSVLSMLLNSLGQVHSTMGKFADSRRYFTEALEIRRRIGDRTGEAKILNSLAVELSNQGRFSDALEYLQLVLAIHVAVGTKADAGSTLHNIGWALLNLKRYDEAREYLTQAAAVTHDAGDLYAEATAEGALGEAYLDLGRYEESAEHYRRAWAVYQSAVREHPGRANVLYGLGIALDSLGRTDEAREAWQTALPILDRAGDPRAAELRGRLQIGTG
jgi:tetratricopeptide (TPR) repeat protein